MNWPEATVAAIACISFAAVLIVGIVMLANIDDDPFDDEEEDESIRHLREIHDSDGVRFAPRDID